MTAREKKKRAAIIAVAYYLEQEAAKSTEEKEYKTWATVGKEMMMGNRTMVQRRGRQVRTQS